jgi:GT2 family glycosyltransferase
MGMVQVYPELKVAAEPICSVCIANYNGAQMLLECLDSVLGQDAGVEVEIIVHDDASTDESVRLIREKYPQVILLVSESNAGFCIANNRMASVARGKYLLLLNNDAALASDAIRTLLTTAQEQNGPCILTLPQRDWSNDELVDCGCLLDLFFNPVPNLDTQRQNVAMTIGACLWIPNLLWHELNGFPEWFGSIAEDLYLCCVARLNGIPIHTTSSSHYRHRQGASFGGNRAGRAGLSTTYRRRALSERNKSFTLYICTPAPLAFLLFPLHLFALTWEGLLLSAIRRDHRLWREVYVNTWIALWSQRVTLHTQRRSIQASRKISTFRFLSCFTIFPRKAMMLYRYGLPKLR